MTIKTQLSIASSFIRTSIALMIFTFFFAIIAGPNVSHRINLSALLLTIISIVIFSVHRRSVDFRAGRLIIIQIVINLGLGLGLLIIKYGYINWHFKNLFELTV